MGVPRRVLDGLKPRARAEQTKAAPSPPITTTSTSTPQSSFATRKTRNIGAKATTRPAPAAASEVWLGFLAIIAEETGVEMRDLKPDTEFAEIGLDSLLSLTITGRVREELKLDFPPSIFSDYPTVRELQQLHGQDAERKPSIDSESCSEISQSGTSTPSSSVESELGTVDFEHIVRATIAEETGISVDDLLPSTRLDEIGVDSLLALTTMGKLGEVFEVELPSSLFAENETLGEIERAIAKVLGVGIKPSSFPTPSSDPILNLSQDPIVRTTPHATSVLLQGSPKSAKSTVFMFPDGSGSASSYAAITRIDPEIAVYGLNCPWRTTPENMARSGCTLAQLSAKFVMELQRRQPKGPYNLGGWSAGGICAFEAARQLVAAGEVVETLILIDTPNPIGLQNPPARMYDFFQQLGIFGVGQKVPKWLRPHFDAFIRILDDYEPVAWPSSHGKSPETLMLYAKDGVCKDPKGPRPEIRPDDPREMIWLLNNRTDFSADGWASLLGRKSLKIEVLEDVNHFSMMDAGSHMETMVAHMRKALV